MHFETETLGIISTVTILRSMRHLGESLQMQPTSQDKLQDLLTDAQKLAQAPAPYFIQLSRGAEHPEILTQWSRIATEMALKYPLLKDTKKIYASSERRLRTALGIMRQFGIHQDEELLTDIFIRGNKLADIQFNDICSPDLTLIAPLSTDIVIANLLAEFIKDNLKKPHPQVKAAIFNNLTKQVTLPSTLETSKALIFVDTNNSGDTKNSLVYAAQEQFPGRIIPTITSR